MRLKTFALMLIAQIFFCQLVFAQDERGVVNVSVRQSNGRKQEEILYRNSYALLIGNSNYAKWKSLPGVARDIPQVEAVLRDKHGFTVEKALNMSKTELLSRIDQFISRYGQDYDNRLLIYYAGHGYTAVLPDKRVMGYLVMRDAPTVPPVEEALSKTPANLGEFRLHTVSMGEIENLAKEISTRHALFVFDSCFSGTALYRDNTITVPQEISSEELEPMRGFLTAGNEKQRVRDDSPFRRAFIKALEGKADSNGDGYILSSELGAFVKREVYLETRDTEIPQSPIFDKPQNFRRGDLIFITPGRNVAVVRRPQLNNSSEASAVKIQTPTSTQTQTQIQTPGGRQAQSQKQSQTSGEGQVQSQSQISKGTQSQSQTQSPKAQPKTLSSSRESKNSLFEETSFNYEEEWNIGSGARKFAVKWSGCDNNCIYAYSDKLDGIANSKVADFDKIGDFTRYDRSSRVREIRANQILVLRNSAGYYALVLITDISYKTKQLTVRYKILQGKPQSSAWKPNPQKYISRSSSGSIRFTYEDNDGYFVITDGTERFNLSFDGLGNGKVRLYNDDGISLLSVEGGGEIASNRRTAELGIGDRITIANKNGARAVIKILDARTIGYSSDTDEVFFEYQIFGTN